MSIAYLEPKQPGDIAPLADFNVERTTGFCLDINTKSVYVVKRPAMRHFSHAKTAVTSGYVRRLYDRRTRKLA